MPASVITSEDLREFKMELLEDLKEILQTKSSETTKKWLKSNEVKALLDVSPGTLQNLRINGTLPYTKLGGTIFYDAEEIQRVLAENRIHNKF